eukprot:TRINITY_DN28497_c2_g1_i10.p1 TRINITY_DN28497_c2_g1~~TRINITY_DN28497_c2_g1_i10.p1  ORF type:complete len:290 (+),score=30.76 TRINITY_DN28497_c2_g1_i10:412-1281(+)
MQNPLTFLQPDETAKNFLVRTWVDPIPSGVNLIDKFIRLKPGSVLEITGQPSTRKTMILCHLIATCILPKENNLGGQGCFAIFIDVKMKLDILLVSQIIKQRISQHVQDHQMQEEILRQSLERLRILRCNSTLQLLIAINQLKNILEQIRRENQRALMIFIDGIDAYHAIDRQLGKTSIMGGRDPLSVQTIQESIVRMLTKILKAFKPLIVLSKTSKIEVKEGGKFKVKDPLHKEWSKIVSQKVIVAQEDGKMVCKAEWVLPKLGGLVYFVATIDGVELVNQQQSNVQS